LHASARPLVSVVVFIYNAAATIERALASVAAQKPPQVELVVMDGGSTDGTVEIIRKYESSIAFWRTRRDGSAAVAINEGVQRASGEVIGLLPGDDWYERGALARVVDAFRADPKLDVLSTGCRYLRARADGVPEVVKQFLDERSLAYTMANLVRWPMTPARFIRREYYTKLSGYNAGYLISNDLDFLIKVLQQRPRTRTLPAPVYNFEVHPGSRSLGGERSMVLEMLRGNIGVAEEHLRSRSFTRAERAELRGLHGRASTRLAWTHLRGGERAAALRVVGRALRRNWALPLMVPVWAARRALRREGFF
jgi:glycosyltransferase involved in cell wall biosynthesis